LKHSIEIPSVRAREGFMEEGNWTQACCHWKSRAEVSYGLDAETDLVGFGVTELVCPSQSFSQYAHWYKRFRCTLQVLDNFHS
jgi:hypothetical protein